MSKFKTALTRKFGPLPAWAWGLIAFGVIFFYRRYKAAQSGSGTGTGSVAPTAATPQDPVTLQPGESVYDPNTGGLTTAPGGGGGGDTTGTTGDTSGNNDNGGGSGDAPGGGGNVFNIFPPGASKPWKPKRPKGVPKNAKWHGNHSPGKGWRGVGGGWWVPPKHPGKGKGRERSTATMRAGTGGRNTGKGKGKGRSGWRGRHPGGKGKGRASGGATVSSYARQRPTTPIVSHVSNQRRVGGMQPGPRRPEPAIQHRPSAPTRVSKPRRRVVIRRRKK